MTPARADVSVLIPAAGSGQRLGLGPKGWLMLHGRPVIDWVCDKARLLGDEILVACPAGVDAPPGCVRVEGGATRQESVQRLARAASRPWTLLWDAARPFGSLELAQAVLRQAAPTGAGGAFLLSEVPVGLVEQGRLARSLPAGSVASFQTPQAFQREVLLAIMDQALAQGWQAQSIVELALRAGHEIGMAPGEKLNIKLTTAQDWQLAQHLRGLLG
jgi:2-C-methyl-D-erythritol 4-phosphate cytidylyltransferase